MTPRRTLLVVAAAIAAPAAAGLLFAVDSTEAMFVGKVLKPVKTDEGWYERS
jgi:hypothetical protein